MGVRTPDGVQIEKNSLSRLTPPLDKVLPTMTGGGGVLSEILLLGQVLNDHFHTLRGAKSVNHRASKC